ncbi:hypothetical protein MNBD_GAMMA09-1212 [hydrothermal vent metagenome]|uniref:Uncharacterized protein n=1 Tax=hydrothermal vent metagenome TaxID=652676 RepID=A0A3B0XRK7_9ZZZZ
MVISACFFVKVCDPAVNGSGLQQNFSFYRGPGVCRFLGKLFQFHPLYLLLLVSVMVYGQAQAGANPFKKSKSYNFGSDVSWQVKNGAVLKSGSVRDGSDTHYYHLNINESRLLLRLGRNDPSGTIRNTRELESMAIADVRIDGVRLSVFDWCLQNQKNPSKKLKQYAVVANNTCVNAGGGGDFMIKLDSRSRNALKKTDVLEIVVEPYGRPVKLRYDMAGFAALMTKVENAGQSKKPVAAAHKPKSRAKPKPVAEAVKPKPKPRPKPKKAKICYASPPTNFESVVKPVSYPCDNKAKKTSAEKKMLARVDAEKKKNRERTIKAEKEEEYDRLKSVAESKRDADWENRQAALWIPRCERHWKKGNSPCYCDKYIKSAPPGITSTCDK